MDRENTGTALIVSPPVKHDTATPYLDILAAHAPFSEMTVEDREALLANAQVTRHGASETLLPANAVVEECWIVVGGRVRGERPDGSSVSALELITGDMFPVGALLTSRPVVNHFFAVDEVFALHVPAKDFLEMVARSPALAEFCGRRLAYLLERSRRALQASYAVEGSAEHQLPRNLGSLIRQAPVTATKSESIINALTRMQNRAVGSIVVVDDEQRPAAIFTERDVIPRVMLAGISMDASIESVATSPVATLPTTATAVEAALLMAERSFRHVVIVDDTGALKGVVSERDLFALQRHTLTGVSRAISRANSVAQLAICANDTRQLARNLIAQGVDSLTMTRFVSRLNDQTTQRLIALAAQRHAISEHALCWIALGSQGRHEQSIAAEQNNALIVRVDAEIPSLAKFATEVNESLAQCGFPLCKNQLMASNPAYSLDVNGWDALFGDWIERGDPERLLQANPFFDLRPVWGDAALAHTLHADVLTGAANTPRFLKHLASNALATEPPLNWLGNLSATAEVGHRQVIDLKRYGVRPMVDAARALALAHQISATNTIDRLNALVAIDIIKTHEAQAWTDAFGFMQSLLLRAQEKHQWPDMPNVIALDTLSLTDARILKECFRQARKLQQRLAAENR